MSIVLLNELQEQLALRCLFWLWQFTQNSKTLAIGILDQGSSNYGLGAKSGSRKHFVNDKKWYVYE